MKKLISLLLSMAMVFSMTAVQALAADEETAMLADTGAEGTDAPVAQTVTLDLSKGSIVISKTGYKQGGGAQIKFTGAYTIEQSDKSNLTNTIRVEDGEYQITMKDVSIDVSQKGNVCAFMIWPDATVDLKLEGKVTLKSGKYQAGLSVPEGAAVNISAKTDSDILTVKGGVFAAGIGGGSDNNGGNITILSGTVNADSEIGGGAGIGGGKGGTGTGKREMIHIYGGKVTANGGSGAGIGGGSNANGTGQNGQIIIDGNAVVKATGANGAGIGGGYGANGTGVGGKITLSGLANVTANADSGAGIGSGCANAQGVYLTGESGEVLITENVTVEASSKTGAGIGGGEPANETNRNSYGTGTNGKLTINRNAKVTANSKKASGIGSGWADEYPTYSYTTSEDGVISISDSAIVEATGAIYGIGGYDCTDMNGSLNISGGTVTARATSTYDTYACGIGRISKFNVYGGTVNASGYTGIYRANVNGGVVTAESVTASNGFGTLSSGDSGNSWVFSSPEQTSAELSGGVLFSGSEGKIIGSSYTLPADREIPVDTVMTVEEDQELTVPVGTTLKVNGKLIVNGKLVVAGTLNTAETGAIAGSGETEITGKVTGKKLPIAIQAHDMSTMEKTFDVSTLFTIPKTAGEATYTVTKDGETVTLDGTTLSIPDGGVFTVTVTTEETANYQAASATATLTATVHNHQLRAVAAKAPDCLNAGNIAYWVCESGCGKYFSDESGENVITAAETVLPAKGHQFDNGVCTACGAEDPAYETGAVIEVGSCNAYPGDTITIPVSLKNNKGIASIMFTVSYDANCLEYQGASFTEALTGLSNTVAVNDETTGKVTMSWVKGASGEYTGSETIANLKFEVIAVSENTSAQVSLTYDKENVFNESLKNQNFLIKNGTVQIGQYRPGDINGDGKVNVDDALLLLNYVCDLRKDEVKGNPDVNGDGAVNNKDVVILLRYIAEYPGITLY